MDRLSAGLEPVAFGFTQACRPFLGSCECNRLLSTAAKQLNLKHLCFAKHRCYVFKVFVLLNLSYVIKKVLLSLTRQEGKNQARDKASIKSFQKKISLLILS